MNRQIYSALSTSSALSLIFSVTVLWLVSIWLAISDFSEGLREAELDFDCFTAADTRAHTSCCLQYYHHVIMSLFRWAHSHLLSCACDREADVCLRSVTRSDAATSRSSTGPRKPEMSVRLWWRLASRESRLLRLLTSAWAIGLGVESALDLSLLFRFE